MKKKIIGAVITLVLVAVLISVIVIANNTRNIVIDIYGCMQYNVVK